MVKLEYLFVYGVFRDAGHGLLDDAIFCDKAYVYGRIYEVNEFYPGYIKESCNNRVYGDIYLVESPVFKNLDEFEGDEYTRIKVFCDVLDDECWIYEYRHDVSKFKEVKGGDWILR